MVDIDTKETVFEEDIDTIDDRILDTDMDDTDYDLFMADRNIDTIDNHSFGGNNAINHKCIVMFENDCDRWRRDNLYYCMYDNTMFFGKEHIPVRHELYTKNEVIDFYKEAGWNFPEEEVDECIKDFGTFVSYDDWYESDDEYFSYYYRLPHYGKYIMISCRYKSNAQNSGDSEV